jgi:membrane associated rhomboid family serine protease
MGLIPIGDDNVQGGPPALVTWAFIGLNVLAFFLELSQPSAALQSFITAWGVVPKEYSTGHDIAPLIPLPFWSTLVTSMFLHGGWMHLLGNCLYLWVFGNNVEDSMGRLRFLIFYVLCGLTGAAAQVLASPASPVPMIGASGAISGVLGAYLWLYPRVRVRLLIGIFLVPLPAYLVLLFWIGTQILMAQASRIHAEGGVAVWAHIGGFAAGLFLVHFFRNRTLVDERTVGRHRLHPDHP